MELLKLVAALGVAGVGGAVIDRGGAQNIAVGCITVLFATIFLIGEIATQQKKGGENRAKY